MDQTHRQTLQIQLKNSTFQNSTREVNLSRLVGVVSAICLSSFYFGYTLVYLPAESVKDLSKTFGTQILQTGSKAILLTTVCLGALIGSFMTPFLLPILSRRTLILLFNLIAFIAGGIIQISNIWVLLICRVFQGVCCAQFLSVVPSYIGQLAPKNLMGRFAVYPSLFVMVGIVASYLLALILHFADQDAVYQWRIQFSPTQLTLLIQSILFISGFIPQSPVSLLKDEKIEEARKVIQLFTKDEYVDQVLRKRQDQANSAANPFCMSDKASVESNKKQYNWKAKFLSIQLPVMQQMTGICGLATQAGFIIGNFNPTLGLYTPFTFNTIQMLANIVPVFLYERIGRKNITLFGNLGIGICNMIIAILFVFIDQVACQYVAWSMFLIYMVIFGLAVGPIVGIYAGELSPPSYGFGSNVISWVFANLVIVSLSLLTDAYHVPYPAFFIFGGWTLISFVCNILLLKETKGLKNEEIMKFYGKEV